VVSSPADPLLQLPRGSHLARQLPGPTDRGRVLRDLQVEHLAVFTDLVASHHERERMGANHRAVGVLRIDHEVDEAGPDRPDAVLQALPKAAIYFVPGLSELAGRWRRSNGSLGGHQGRLIPFAKSGHYVLVSSGAPWSTGFGRCRGPRPLIVSSSMAGSGG